MGNEELEAARELIEFARRHIADEYQNTHPADMSDLVEAANTLEAYLDR